MQRGARFFLQSLFLLLTYSLLWLSLWVISFYLSHNGQQAALFFTSRLTAGIIYFTLATFLVADVIGRMGALLLANSTAINYPCNSLSLTFNQLISRTRGTTDLVALPTLLATVNLTYRSGRI